jgi:heptosyltransferase-1
MGDVIHALPALTDAMRLIPGIRFDWVVEEAFQEIPSWHPAVNKVIPVALRRWRKHPLKAIVSGEWRSFKQALRKEHYDLVLDSQGLIKSAWLARKARGVRAGFDRASARESIASWFYQRCYSVAKHGHAITRQRALFAKALGYTQLITQPDSALSLPWVPDAFQPYVVFLQGTSWPSKEWPIEYWIDLANLVRADGYDVKIVWGNEAEFVRAEKISNASDASIMPRLSLGEIADQLGAASAVVGVDSGLAHLAAALSVSAITLYGATDPEKTGARGSRQKNLQGQADCVPCLSRSCAHVNSDGDAICWSLLSPEYVWMHLKKQL